MQVKTLFEVKPKYIMIYQKSHLLLEKQILEQIYVEDDTFNTMISQYNNSMDCLTKVERKITTKHFQDAIFAIMTILNTLHSNGKNPTISIQFRDDDLKRIILVRSLQQMLSIMFYNLTWCRLHENDPDQMTKYLDAYLYVKQANLYDTSLIQDQLTYLKYYITVCYNIGEFALLVDDTVKQCEKIIDEPCPLVGSKRSNQLVEVNVPKLNIDVQPVENETSQVTTETETLNQKIVSYRSVPESITIDKSILEKPQFNQITNTALKIQNIIAEGGLTDQEFEFFRECHYLLTAIQCTNNQLIIQNIKSSVKSMAIKQFLDTLAVSSEQEQDFFNKEIEDEQEDEELITISLYPKNYFAGIQKQCEYINQYNRQLQNYINTHQQVLLNKYENINKQVEIELLKFDSVLSTFKLPEKIQQPQIQEFNQSVKKLYDSYVSLLQTDVQNTQRYQWSSKGFQTYIQKIIAKVCKVGDCINQIVKYYNEYQQLNYEKCQQILDNQEELFEQKKAIIQNEMNNNKLSELTAQEYKQLQGEKDLLAFYLEFGLEQINEQNFRVIQTQINQRSPQLALAFKEQDIMLSNLQALIPKVTSRIIEGKYGISLTDARNTLSKIIELSNTITRLNQQIETTIEQLKANLNAVGKEYKKQVQDQFDAQKNQQQMRFEIKIDNSVIPLLTEIE